MWILLKQETVSGSGISWASTSPLSFLQAGCPSCRPTNSVKALKAHVSCFSNCKIQIGFTFLVHRLQNDLYCVEVRYFHNLSNIDDRVRNISWQTLNLTLTVILTLTIYIHIHGHLGLTGCRNSVLCR